jgi:hypothetical protein
MPRPFLAYYPAIVSQNLIDEQINFIDGPENVVSYSTGHPSKYEPLAPRESYDHNPSLEETALSEAPSQRIRLGDIAQGRSGDKGANLNFGLFVPNPQHWSWLRSYMSRGRMREMLAADDDWDDSFLIERVEFPKIHAVHFVIYGILGRGVSSSSRLDGFGKGFADYVRDKVVEVPTELLALKPHL